MEEHLVQKHEDYIILHSMAKQVENINDKMSDYEQNKSEINQLLKNILANQNIIMQELFLVRNKLQMQNTLQSACSKSSSTGSKINASIFSTTAAITYAYKTFISIVTASPSPEN